jgi:hypothetical protein
MSLKWDSFNKEQFKRKIRELSNSCIEADRLLIITTVDGTPILAIELEADFFSRLYSAGEIDHNTQFKVHRLPPYFFPQLFIWWKTIGEKANFTFNGWRDWGWLKLLCQTKKTAMVSKQFPGKAIVVDNLKTDVLWNSLVMSTMFPAPKEYMMKE